METKTLYVKEESYVITKNSLVKALLLVYKSGVDNGILMATDPQNIVPSEKLLKEAFEILENGMADVK